MTWNTFIDYAQQYPWRIGIVVYFIVGFVVVRHIYSDDEERLGSQPFDRIMHVLFFGSMAAWLWPFLLANWWMHFRQSEEK